MLNAKRYVMVMNSVRRGESSLMSIAVPTDLVWSDLYSSVTTAKNEEANIYSVRNLCDDKYLNMCALCRSP